MIALTAEQHSTWPAEFDDDSVERLARWVVSRHCRGLSPDRRSELVQVAACAIVETLRCISRPPHRPYIGLLIWRARSAVWLEYLTNRPIACPRHYKQARRGPDAFARNRLASIDAPLGSSSDQRPTRLVDVLASREPDPAQKAIDHVSVQQALARLHPRHRHVVTRHWLDGMTFEEIGRELSITRQRVEQIHSTAFKKLREMLA